MRKYYTLLTRDADNRWAPQFGDYFKDVVEEELQDYRRQGYARKDLKIIATGAKQSEINAEVVRLNQEAPTNATA